MPSRRTAVANINSRIGEHAGLWFDRYLKTQHNRKVQGEKSQYATHVADTVSIAAKQSHIYKAYFERWEAMLTGMDNVTLADGAVKHHMLLGLGNESVIETGVTLHHTYGMPYIPGSALKGLTAAYAHQAIANPVWKKKGEAHQIVFGSSEPDMAGFVTFYDALLIPQQHEGKRPLYADILTPHHGDYYGNKRGSAASSASLAAPADWDDPTPVSFLRIAGTYLLALRGPQEWVDAAYQLLTSALAEMGIGAKTSSGYGRMNVKPRPKPEIFVGVVTNVTDHYAYIKLPDGRVGRLGRRDVLEKILKAGDGEMTRAFWETKKVKVEVFKANVKGKHNKKKKAGSDWRLKQLPQYEED